MRAIFILAAAALTGCAATPDRMAQQSNWDVCRFTMGGPSAHVAEQEAQRRGLDCAPLYPAINARQQNQNAATNSLIQQLKGPPPAPVVHCTSNRVGNTTQTDCQ
jgi:hypothetical protein